jgi:hypothetical protein
MQENIGRVDQIARGLIGATFITLGYVVFGAPRGKIGGLLSMIAGALVAESALTRVSLVNRLFRIDSRKLDRKVLPKKWVKTDEYRRSTEINRDEIDYASN